MKYRFLREGEIKKLGDQFKSRYYGWNHVKFVGSSVSTGDAKLKKYRRPIRKSADICLWFRVTDLNMWFSMCRPGRDQHYIHNSPKANGFRFCPYCGKKLKPAKGQEL